MLLTLLFCAGLVGLDQLFKWLAVTYLMPLGAYTVLPGVVGFQYVENTGAAFNIFAGRQIFLIIITGVALLGVAWYLVFRRPQNKLEYCSLVLIFSGGVGNLIDRIANGYVVDYIEFLFVRFAVFNFADILVCVGFALLFFAVVQGELRQAKKAKEQAGQQAAPPEQEPGDAPDD